MEKPVALKLVVKSKLVFIWPAGKLCSDIQGCQIPELKLFARVTVKSLRKSENWNLSK